jgi:putative glutathione S-transferase
MGMLVDGEWRDEDPVNEIGKAGNFQRVDSVFRDRITADGSSGFPAEAGRYHLYVAYTCPWAHRTQIYLALKKLGGLISVAVAVPGLREQGWTFEDNPAFADCTPDRVNGFRYLHQAYSASNPHYTGKVTVPTLWDKKTKRIVNNESSEIIRMLNSEFGALGADPTDFYPKPLRAEIDRINAQVYANVNNGVYRCGFARHSTRSRRGSAASAIWSAIRSPRPTGGCFRRSCASTWLISRCSNVTATGSPTSRIC